MFNKKPLRIFGSKPCSVLSSLTLTDGISLGRWSMVQKTKVGGKPGYFKQGYVYTLEHYTPPCNVTNGICKSLHTSKEKYTNNYSMTLFK